MKRLSLTFIFFHFLCCPIFALQQGNDGAKTFQVVVLTGQQLEGAPINDFSDAVIDDFGNAAFNASWDNGSGIVGSKNGLKRIAYFNGPVAGQVDDVRYLSLGDPIVTGNGRVAFSAVVSGFGIDSSNERTLVAGDFSNAEIVAQSGSGFNFFSGPRLSSNGAVGFGASFPGAAGNGIWRREPDGTLTRISQTGGSTVGVSLGGMNDKRQFVYTTTSVFQTGAPAWSIFKSGGQITSTGRSVSGTTGDVRYNFFSTTSMNNLGNVSFLSTLTGNDVTSDNNLALFTDRDGSLEMVVRKGELAFSGDPNSRIDIIEDQFINGRNELVYHTKLSGDDVNLGNDDALWFHGDDDRQLIVREGGNLLDRGVVSRFDSFSINGLGHVVFRAITTEGTGIFVFDHQNLSEVVFSGDLVDVDADLLNSDLRTVQSLRLSSSSNAENGSRRVFNNAGELVFTATFSDDSRAILIAPIKPVPEPGTLVFLSCIALAAAGLRRRAIKQE